MFDEIINGIMHEIGEPYCISFSNMGFTQCVTFKDKIQLKNMLNCNPKDATLDDIMEIGSLYDESENRNDYVDPMSGNNCIDIDMSEISIKDFRKDLANYYILHFNSQNITKLEEVSKETITDLIKYKVIDLIFKHNKLKTK